MLYILSALSASVAAYLWIEVLAIDLLLKRWMGMDESYSFKPFDCRLCMSFWLGVAMCCFHEPEALLYVPLLSVLFERLMWRFEL
jgi:hypothetical protein